MSPKSQNGKSARAFIIANPLYDTVFKKLMENKQIVKFFLSTILGQQVVEVEILPQEFTHKGTVNISGEVPYSILRVDFMATIKTDEGEQKKILIEVQKSRNHDDMIRCSRS